MILNPYFIQQLAEVGSIDTEVVGQVLMWYQL